MLENNLVIQRAMNYVNQLLIPLENHYYHHYEHALDVMQRAVYLAKKEGLSDDDIEILALSALFHDTWFIIQYDKNEPIWAKIAQNYLKMMMYDREKIDLIEQIILATDPDYKTPQNIYEKIIKDADLDNLGRHDFWDKTNDLNKEVEAIKQIKLKDPNWRHWVIEFLAEHKYYTQTQQYERNHSKKENKHRLQKMVEELEKDEI